MNHTPEVEKFNQAAKKEWARYSAGLILFLFELDAFVVAAVNVLDRFCPRVFHGVEAPQVRPCDRPVLGVFHQVHRDRSHIHAGVFSVGSSQCP